MSLDELPTVLTVEEFAAAMRLGRGTAYAAVRTGAVPSVRVGRAIRIPRRVLLELLGEPVEKREAGFPASEPRADENVDGDATSTLV